MSNPNSPFEKSRRKKKPMNDENTAVKPEHNGAPEAVAESPGAPVLQPQPQQQQQIAIDPAQAAGLAVYRKRGAAHRAKAEEYQLLADEELAQAALCDTWLQVQVQQIKQVRDAQAAQAASAAPKAVARQKQPPARPPEA